MKKLILFIASAIFTVAASAQIQFGAKAGLNLTSLTNSDREIENVKLLGTMTPNFYLGVFAEYTISDFVGIQPELVYSRQGNHYNGNNLGIVIKISNRIDYLNVPIMAKLYVLDNLSLDLGPQFGFLLSAKSETTISETGTDMDGTVKQNFKKETNGLDVSFGMGVSYKIMGKIDVSIRYNLGLTDIAKENDTNDKVKNGVIQVGLGYRF